MLGNNLKYITTKTIKLYKKDKFVLISSCFNMSKLLSKLKYFC